MNNELIQGLQISLMGLVITFLSLGVFILVMVVLKRMFPAREEPADAGEIETVIEIKTDMPGEEGAVIAAIAAAMAYLEEKGLTRGSASLGSDLQKSRGAWWQARRSEAVRRKQ